MSKLLVDEIGGNAAAETTIASGKKIAGTASQFKMTDVVQGDVLYGSAADTINRLAKGTAAQVLSMNSGATAPEWATSAAGGKILQIVQTLKTDETTTTSASFVDISGMTVSITPSAVTSKVLLFVTLNVNGGDLYMINIRLMRDSTPIFIGDQAAVNRARSTFVHRIKDAQTSLAHSGQYLDSPATTSAITYKAQWAEEAGETARLNFPSAGSDIFKYGTTSSTMTVMEVGV